MVVLVCFGMFWYVLVLFDPIVQVLGVHVRVREAEDNENAILIFLVGSAAIFGLQQNEQAGEQLEERFVWSLRLKLLKYLVWKMETGRDGACS